jgi:hypothetical protein
MTAPTLVYCYAPKKAWEALLALGTPKLMLVDAAFTPNQDTNDFVNDITNEAAGTGYTGSIGGLTLASPAVSLDASTNTIKITCTDVSGISVPCRWGVFNVWTGTASTSPVLAYTDFSQGVGGNVTLTSTTSLSTTGFLNAVVS